MWDFFLISVIVCHMVPKLWPFKFVDILGNDKLGSVTLSLYISRTKPNVFKKNTSECSHIKLCIKADYVSQKKWIIILDIFSKILVYIELTFKGPFIFDGILPASMPVNESANKATIRMYILSRYISQGTKYLAK